ncbi:MAG: hypothetical protein R2843_07275 [Thermomicrobiales bacterium]
MQFGDLVTVRSPGGGGYGDPHKRDPQAVLDDVKFGLVSIDSARNDYGVAITADLCVDEATTTLLRGA